MTVAIYTRTSTAVEEGASLEVQKGRCIKFCEAKGWEDWKVYVDEAFSGVEKDRPAFNEMFEDARAGKVSKVLVWRLDRFSRRFVDAVNLLEELKDLDITFHSVEESIDFSTDLGEAMFGILTIFADLERKAIATRTGEGKAYRLNEGLVCGGNVPIGYVNLSKEKAVKLGKKPGIYIDPEKAKMVKRVFELYAQEENQTRIVHKLKAEGFDTHQTTVRNIIGRECYYSGKWDNKHTIRKRQRDGSKKVAKVLKSTLSLPPIIDKKLWDKVQRVRKAHASQQYSGADYFLFKGRLMCVACGKPMFTSYRQGGSYDYYMHYCNGPRKGSSKSKQQNAICIPSKEIDQAIWNALVEKIHDAQSLKRTIEALKEEGTKEKVDDLKRQVKAIGTEIGKHTRNKSKYAKRVLETDSKDAIVEYEKEMQRLGGKIRALERSKEAIQEKMAEAQELALSIDSVDQLIKSIQAQYEDLSDLSFEKRRELVEKIYPPGSIEFFPKWWIEAVPDKAEQIELFKPMLKKSGQEVRKGFLMCTGLIDYDYQESRKRPDMKKLKEEVKNLSINGQKKN
jgi:site-specific DNA recombinase